MIEENKEPINTEDYKPRPPVAPTSASGGEGMSALGKALVVGLIVLIAGIGLLVWKTQVGGGHKEMASLTKIMTCLITLDIME